ncbi:hypothetical protein AUC71_11075 [Methyloceanibacter marginalis]|uniref:Uncharacterized protein n=1 Tax=Methyloceanibacter marginalis TaxID=1774971 RepID=A0A1E3WBS6_9HYPH|nr:hypothetical protein [Methyloceanibacter marginalis]ODS03180.1 hypothetical protein AUC71_11075 [Methyloceanibacter marginalis]
MIAAVISVFSFLARTEPVGALEATRFGSIGPKPFDDAIDRVTLRHGLVSSQTDLAAWDSVDSRPDGKVVTTTKLRLNLPDGRVYAKVYGRPAGTLRRPPHRNLFREAPGRWLQQLNRFRHHRREPTPHSEIPIRRRHAPRQGAWRRRQ